MKVVVEYAKHAAARMNAQVAADLPAGVSQALPLEQRRRVDRARGEDHVRRAHLEATVALQCARLGVERRSAHANRATVLDGDAVHAAAGDDPRAGLRRER